MYIIRTPDVVVLIFSVMNGTALTFELMSNKDLLSNNFHFGKEPQELYWGTWAVHKDSPLKVHTPRFKVQTIISVCKMFLFAIEPIS